MGGGAVRNPPLTLVGVALPPVKQSTVNFQRGGIEWWHLLIREPPLLT
jgi:hypothetical protein